MDLTAVVHDRTANWDRKAPAAEADLDRIVEHAPITLPDAYFEFLRLSNGGEGILGVYPGWFQIWPAEEVPRWNDGYEVQRYIPDYYGFGSNLGGDFYAFRNDDPAVYTIPLIGMEEAMAHKVADSFEEFVAKMGRN